MFGNSTIQFDAVAEETNIQQPVKRAAGEALHVTTNHVKDKGGLQGKRNDFELPL